MGCTAPIGSEDQDRIRHLTFALPPPLRRRRRTRGRRRRPATPGDRRRSAQRGLLPGQRPPRRLLGSPVHGHRAPRVRLLRRQSPDAMSPGSRHWSCREPGVSRLARSGTRRSLTPARRPAPDHHLCSRSARADAVSTLGCAGFHGPLRHSMLLRSRRTRGPGLHTALRHSLLPDTRCTCCCAGFHGPLRHPMLLRTRRAVSRGIASVRSCHFTHPFPSREVCPGCRSSTPGSATGARLRCRCRGRRTPSARPSSRRSRCRW